VAVQFYNEKALLVDGKVAVDPSCCCGGGTASYDCCFECRHSAGPYGGYYWYMLYNHCDTGSCSTPSYDHCNSADHIGTFYYAYCETFATAKSQSGFAYPS